MDIATGIAHWPLPAIAAIVAGVAVLVAPRVLNYAVAAYLLVVGALGLLYYFQGHAIRAQAVISLVAGVLVLVRPNILNYVIGVYLVLVGLMDAGVIRI